MTWHRKNHKYFNSPGKRQSIDTDVMRIQMLEISDRDFNVAIIQTLQEAIMNTLAVSVTQNLTGILIGFLLIR